jgi:hypothetical protein
MGLLGGVGNSRTDRRTFVDTTTEDNRAVASEGGTTIGPRSTVNITSTGGDTLSILDRFAGFAGGALQRVGGIAAEASRNIGVVASGGAVSDRSLLDTIRPLLLPLGLVVGAAFAVPRILRALRGKK